MKDIIFLTLNTEGRVPKKEKLFPWNRPATHFV